MPLLEEDVKLLDSIRNQYLEREKKGLAIDQYKLVEQLNCLESGILIIRNYLAIDLKNRMEKLQQDLKHANLEDLIKTEHHIRSQIDIPIKKDEDELLPWLALAEEAIEHSEDNLIQKKMGSELFLDLAMLTYNVMQQNNLKMLKIVEEKIQETRHLEQNQQKDSYRKKPK